MIPWKTLATITPEKRNPIGAAQTRPSLRSIGRLPKHFGNWTLCHDQIFGDLSLAQKIWIVASIGLLVSCLYGSILLVRDLGKANELSQTEQLVGMSVTLGNLVHEQQKERGASSVFLASQGREFGQEMAEQRKLTDARRQELKATLATVRENGISPGLERSLSKLEASVLGLDEYRKRIDSLSLTRAEQVAHYTAINNQAISVSGLIGQDVADAELARDLMVYSALLSGKDLNGIMRSVGSSGFAIRDFEQGLGTRLIELEAAQRSLFRYVAQFGSSQTADTLAAIEQSPAAKRLDNWRAIALSGDAERIASVSASDWFDAKTEKIGELKTLEDAMAQDIQTSARAKSDTAMTGALLNISAMAIALALALVFSRFTISHIGHSIQKIITPLDALARGEIDTPIAQVTSAEIGRISSALEMMRRAAKERRRKAKVHEDEIVHTLGERLNAMADGDLDRPITEPFSDTYEPLRKSFNKTQSILRDVIKSVMEVSNGIGTQANQVNAAADDLAGRATRQAATIEDAAKALRQSVGELEGNAEKAQSTNTNVAKARKTASENGKTVESAVEAMGLIESSFAEIEQITQMIQAIAFQTNILALNAGVEATRAGEAGKGFNVVASEVRALAQRSSEAVTQIQELMGKSAERISVGSSQVIASGDALQDMIKTIDSVSGDVAEMADACFSQARGLSDISASVSALEQDTQRNAAMAEESTRASGLLHGQVEKLEQAAAVFQRSDGGVGNSAGVGEEFDLRMSA